MARVEMARTYTSEPTRSAYGLPLSDSEARRRLWPMLLPVHIPANGGSFVTHLSFGQHDLVSRAAYHTAVSWDHLERGVSMKHQHGIVNVHLEVSSYVMQESSSSHNLCCTCRGAVALVNCLMPLQVALDELSTLSRFAKFAGRASASAAFCQSIC